MKKSAFCICIILFMSLINITTSFSALLVLQPGGAVGKDAMICSGNTGNHGNTPYLSASCGVTNGLIEFDLSSIPLGSTINSATLELLEYQNCATNVNSFEIHTTLNPWQESTVNWSNRPPFDPVSLATSTGEAGGACEWLIFDASSIVQDWFNGTTQNYGLRITGPSSGSTGKWIYSSDAGTPASRPILRIDYTPGPVPTMNEWGMIIFMVLAGIGAIYYLRRKRIAN